MHNLTEHAIHSVLQQRWSPYSINPNRAVSDADRLALFEAARWAPSAFNAQPWRYIVGVKGANDGVWEKIHGLLLVGNQGWTQNAPVLALGVIRTEFEHNGKTNPTALHDLGAASAHLSVEATARGLSVHQMSGIRADDAHTAFGLEPQFQVITALAIGYAGPSDLDPEIAQRDQRPRQRKALAEIILTTVEETAVV